ncbi:MaoC/PaaZ C-terminal domain-containing protein [Roseovarius sp.]|uniref:MaoC/PaaZ C-terminal domain-containing protein n=1 Tax=Roseovarius sp. TaxID=1486281 RepID=UPI00261E60C0|nr:MaoC/PaaZ C-terminal domain-containing protein [Roseovarius sp.]MDM8166745.1 MaoC/PaaZ C-terminal domain-containing protein [Roseovarius sp.]
MNQEFAPEIGERSSYTTEPVTTKQIVMYAGASGDFNQIHYDQSYAESAGLGGVIAHGMLTMGMAGRCVTDWAGPGRFVEDVRGRFLHPVKPGDRVTFALEVTGVGEAVEMDLTGHVGETQVFKGTARVAGGNKA